MGAPEILLKQEDAKNFIASLPENGPLSEESFKKMGIKNNKIVSVVRFFRRAFGQYKFQIIFLIAMGFLSAFLEGLGINALIPLLGFVSGKGGGNDTISRFIERSFGYFNIGFNLKYLLIFICLLFMFKAVVLTIAQYIKLKITVDYEEGIRKILLEKTLKADWTYLSKQKLGYLETIILTDVDSGSRLLQQMSAIIMLVTSLIIYLVIALNIEFMITVSVLAISVVLVLLFKPFISWSRALAKETSGLTKKISNFVNEYITGIKTVKTLLVETEVLEVAKEHFKTLKELRIKLGIIKTILMMVIEPISFFVIAVIFAISYKAKDFNFAVLAAVIYLIYRIFMYTSSLQGQLQGIGESMPYLEAALNYVDKAIKCKEKNIGLDKFRFEKTLEFKNINFSYQAKTNILTDVSFVIKNREMVGLIGPSGAGKTTSVDLILRLLEPNSGAILIDGKDIKNININDLRKNIGYVSQDLFLKNDTFENNIKFYDKSISDEDMIRAAKIAFIYDVIQSTPDRFQTVIGERGINLSAGQRQRVVLARVLARKPQFLILDEATSSLDNESEIKIQQAIENLKSETTVLAIAHRLSTIMNCDKIISLENGRIIEQGTPEELLNDVNSYFYKVYNIRKNEKQDT